MHPVSKGPVSHVISLARIFALQHIPVRFFRWCGWVAMHIGSYYHCACTAAKGHYCCLQEREYQSNNRLTDRPTDPLAPLLSRSTREWRHQAHQSLFPPCGYRSDEGEAVMDGKSSPAYRVDPVL